MATGGKRLRKREGNRMRKRERGREAGIKMKNWLKKCSKEQD